MKFPSLLLLLLFTGATAPLSAYVVARFDVGGSNANGAPQALQSGWADLNPTNMSATQTGITLAISDPSPESRDRTGPVIAGNPLENVFRDFLFTRAADGPVSVTFSGLLPNTEYEITGYAYDASGGNDETGFWYLGSVAPENLQHSWVSSIATLDDPGDVFLLTGTSDESGVLTYVVTTNNTSRINGFMVERATPASDISYRIDLDNSETLGGPFTEPGWTSLPLVNGSTSGSVDIGGVNFSVSGFAGSRNRATTNSTTLTRDFVFSNGAEIKMAFGAAGDLPAGVWEVSMWSWDQDVAASIPPATVGYRVNGGADVVAGTGLSIDPAYPVATFQFTSDGVSSYEAFIRSDTLSGNARFNAVSLSLLPPPAAALVGFTYNPADGSAEVSIQGSANTNYKLVEADDLDFANPDQDPIPLTGATVGALTGNEVTTDGNGNATVQFNLGTAKSATFLRAETGP